MPLFFAVAYALLSFYSAFMNFDTRVWERP